MFKRLAATSIGIILTLLASPVWAVQTHGGAEGLVSHQISHILLIIGMGYLLFRLQILKQKNHGWGAFKVFLWLIIAWSLLTFLGHWLNEFIPAERFIKTTGKTEAFSIKSFSDALFYLSRLDHLLLLPAFLSLLLALHKWSREP